MTSDKLINIDLDIDLSSDEFKKDKLKMSQAQLADSLAIDVGTISRYECEKRSIPGLIARWMNLLNMPDDMYVKDAIELIVKAERENDK